MSTRTFVLFVFVMFLFMVGCDSATKKIVQDKDTISDSDQLVSDEDGLLGDGDELVTDEQSEGVQDDNVIAQDDNVVVQEDDVIAQDDNVVVQEDDVIAQDDNVVVQDDDVIVQDDNIIIIDDDTVQPDGDTTAPVVDTVGNTNRNSTGQDRMRGNFYTCTTSRTLTDIEIYFDYTGDATVYFEVYESTALDGTYTPVASVQQDLTMAGADFYSSGTVSIPLTAGNFYYIGARWEAVTLGYSSDNAATSYPTAFGAWSASMRFDSPGGAPASFDYGSITSSDTTAYYQRLTSE